MKTAASYLHIENLLDEIQLNHIAGILNDAPFTDGKNTASDSAREVKNNRQMDMQSSQYMAIQQILLTALNQNSLFRNAALPKNIYPFLISKYTPGNSYGWHVDSPIMGSMMRTDIAMTIFLNDPTEYTGGELEMQTPFGNIQYKLNRGDAICYPCQQLHRVKELVAGERQVAVTWIQSMVKNTDERDILYNIQQVIASLKKSSLNSTEEHILQQSYSNLLRKWGE